MKLKSIYVSALVLLLASCGGTEKGNNDSGDSTSTVSGTINIDGSSTVYPITAGMAEIFGEENPDVKVLVGQSGTGGGFSKFASGESHINDASRPIKESEAADCKAKGIDFKELMVAYDGLSVVVNPKNTWVDKLTMEELKKIWTNGPEKAKTWADVRAGWPKEEIKLYGPGTASGTYDYFVEEVLGKDATPRPDFNSSENDRMLVKGVADDKNSLGYFGFGYYVENKDKLKIVPIDAGKGAITPSEETIMNKTYAPLSRPLFIYVSSKVKENETLKSFVNFYLDNTAEISKTVGFIPMTAEETTAQKAAFEAFLK